MTSTNEKLEVKLEKDEPNPNSNLQKTQEPNKKFIIISIVVIIAIIALIVLASFFLLNAEPGKTEQIRDLFIIYMAFLSLVIGLALVVLIIQLSILINLLQNEIRPIIHSTSETVNTLKGTTKFISNNLTEPVIKMNQAMAVVRQIFRPKKKK